MLNLLKNIISFSLGFLPRTKPVFFIVLLFTLDSNILKSQVNLVPNGSFEEYNWCPNWAPGFYLDACKYWSSPTTGGSPDYFNACSTDLGTSGMLQFSVPQNSFGFQNARTGQGYAGLCFAQVSAGLNTYSEYIQIELSQGLDFGKFYKLQFYLSNAGIYYCSNSIGALFTTNSLNINTEEVIPMSPQFNSDLSLFFCDTTKWYELSYLFQADGSEKYLTIGVFSEMPETYVIDENGVVQLYAHRYYYLDDVSLVEFDYTSWIEGIMPNIFTPNGDNSNDVFTFDNSIVKARKLTILNRWGDVIFQTNDTFIWDGSFDGKPCSDGIYFYQIEITNAIKTNGFLTLIR